MDRNGESTFRRMMLGGVILKRMMLSRMTFSSMMLGGVILKRMMLSRMTFNRMIFNTMHCNK
jgi:hypothetical protein